MNTFNVKYYLSRGKNIIEDDNIPPILTDTIGIYKDYSESIKGDSLIVDFTRQSYIILENKDYHQIYKIKDDIDRDLQDSNNSQLELYINQFLSRQHSIENINLINAFKILVRQSNYFSLTSYLLNLYHDGLVGLGNNPKIIIIDNSIDYLASIIKISYTDIELNKNYMVGYGILYIPITPEQIVIHTKIELFYNPKNKQHLEYLRHKNSLYSKYIRLSCLEPEYTSIDTLQILINSQNFWDNMKIISIPNYIINFIIFIDSIIYIYNLLESIELNNLPEFNNYDIIVLEYNYESKLFDIFHYIYPENYQTKYHLGELSSSITELYQHNYVFICHLSTEVVKVFDNENIISIFIKQILHYDTSNELINNSIICGNNATFSSYMNIIHEEDYEFIEPTNKTAKKTKHSWFGRNKNKKRYYNTRKTQKKK